MKQLSKLFAIALLGCVVVFTSCGTSNAVRGGGIGAGAGAAVGAGIGAIIGGGQGAAWGAGIGAIAGGTAGAIIGNRMDQQAKELEKELGDVGGAQVETVNDGQAIKVTFESGILFATNSSTLNPASQEVLSRFATSLQNNPDTDVKIYGHTDSTGSDAINNPLSQRRAESVMNFLSTRGVTGARMESQGVGSTQPIGDNATATGRTLNRRVEIYILPNAKMIREAEQQAR
ncbi:MAG: OmpA family protein [Dysgonamonadaceae bacterium]|nr:OmpA family protein [Dysgonamonadaceae bacterium]